MFPLGSTYCTIPTAKHPASVVTFYKQNLDILAFNYMNEYFQIKNELVIRIHDKLNKINILLKSCVCLSVLYISVFNCAI